MRIWVKVSFPDYNNRDYIQPLYARGKEARLTAAMILDLNTSTGEQTAISEANR